MKVSTTRLGESDIEGPLAARLILPRYVAGDFERNDDVYDRISEWAPQDELRVPSSRLVVADDKDRRDRTLQGMADEAAVYRNVFQSIEADCD
jgi:hypothetical protein